MYFFLYRTYVMCFNDFIEHIGGSTLRNKNIANLKLRKIDPRIKGTIAAFGFSVDQIEVYFAGLELGTSTAQELSKRTKQDLKTTKDVLQSLMTKNILVKEIVKNGVVQYQVTPFEEVFVDRGNFRPPGIDK